MKILGHSECASLVKTLDGNLEALKVAGHIRRKLSGFRGEDVCVSKWPECSSILIKACRDDEQVGGLTNYVRNVVSIYSKDPSSLPLLLEEAGLQWNKPLMFGGLQQNLCLTVSKVVGKHGGTFSESEPADMLVADRTSLESLPVPSLPPGIFESTLKYEEANVVNANWEYGKTEESLFYVQQLLMEYPTVALRDERNKLVGYELVQPYGALGMLFVFEEFRGRGLAKYIVSQLARKLTSQGLPVFCYVSRDAADYLKSLTLHQKCGFKVIPGAEGIWASYSPSSWCREKQKCCV